MRIVHFKSHAIRAGMDTNICYDISCYRYMITLRLVRLFYNKNTCSILNNQLTKTIQYRGYDNSLIKERKITKIK